MARGAAHTFHPRRLSYRRAVLSAWIFNGRISYLCRAARPRCRGLRSIGECSPCPAFSTSRCGGSRTSRPRPVLRGDDIGQFWLDVHPSDAPIARDPANAPGRVLSEAFAILAAACLLAFAVTALIPGPAFP
ncbi:MAG: hypothetical protein WDM81_18375 [Rhizomicrobium sp.]